MNWEAIAAVGEIVGALAVLITLAYLARQVRQANRQNLLASFQHTYDSINQFLESTLASGELAELVVRGRASYEDLTEADRLRFDHFHLVVLNIVESHLFQVERTADSMEKDYRAWATENMKVVVQAYFLFPGTRTFWSNVSAFFEPGVRQFVSDTLRETPVLDAGPSGIEPG
ncbi:MAG: hypothetical protein RH859_11230 [Longimicrobiales bacterium]